MAQILYNSNFETNTGDPIKKCKILIYFLRDFHLLGKRLLIQKFYGSIYHKTGEAYEKSNI